MLSRSEKSLQAVIVTSPKTESRLTLGLEMLIYARCLHTDYELVRNVREMQNDLKYSLSKFPVILADQAH